MGAPDADDLIFEAWKHEQRRINSFYTEKGYRKFMVGLTGSVSSADVAETKKKDGSK